MRDLRPHPCTAAKSTHLVFSLARASPSTVSGVVLRTGRILASLRMLRGRFEHVSPSTPTPRRRGGERPRLRRQRTGHGGTAGRGSCGAPTRRTRRPPPTTRAGAGEDGGRVRRGRGARTKAGTTPPRAGTTPPRARTSTRTGRGRGRLRRGRGPGGRRRGRARRGRGQGRGGGREKIVESQKAIAVARGRPASCSFPQLSSSRGGRARQQTS